MTTTAPATRTPRAPRITGVHIDALLATTTAVLVQGDDGTTEVLPALYDDLAADPSCVVVLSHADALDLFAAEVDAALQRGERLTRRSLLAAAGREATAELAAIYARGLLGFAGPVAA